MTDTTFERRAPDISCDHCANTIRGAVGGLDGVSAVDVDVDAKRVRVAYDSARIDAARITRELEEQGYPLESDSA